MLPIMSHKNEIIDAVSNNYVTIISAETGAGKSTMIAQFLSEKFSKVIVTEPRVIAAVTLARRVAESMNVTLGKEVGYNTSFEKQYTSNTNILFCTDGIQAVKSILGNNNKEERVLVIDEVHEWNLNIEVLVAFCKLMKNEWNTKVVLMSATIDNNSLKEYFKEDVAVVTVSGTLFDVEIKQRQVDDFLSTIKENIEIGKNILVFVDGRFEIQTVLKDLANTDAVCLPLYGEMSWEEQRKCFEHYDKSKVIVATNVAQTSITIPDIDVVVDNGMEKVLIVDHGCQALVRQDISQADIMQRKGRAGRTKEGMYFLCSDIKLNQRDKYSIPEIQRSILDRVVLQLAVIGLDAEKLDFYHQPNTNEIISAKQALIAMGALTSVLTPTAIGKKMVQIPVSARFARMIVEAEKYGVTDQVITIVAILENGSLLYGKNATYEMFTYESESDLLAELETWDYLGREKKIDFTNLCINQKVYYKVKKHIQRLHDVLKNVIEITHNDDRKAILKSCLSGMVSDIYTRDQITTDSRFCTSDMVVLNDKSCVCSGSNFYAGYKRKFSGINKYGDKWEKTVLVNVTEIDNEMICDILPNDIEEKVTKKYESDYSANVITTTKLYKGYAFSVKRHIDNDDFADPIEQKVYRQEEIMIDGKKFDIKYDFDGNPYVFLTEEDLNTITVDSAWLDNDYWLRFTSEYSSQLFIKISELKEELIRTETSRLITSTLQEYEKIAIKSIYDFCANSDKFSKLIFKSKNMDLQDVEYGCAEIYGNKVILTLINDEKRAKLLTNKALKFLFDKEVEEKYRRTKFSHVKGKKHRNLTDEEEKVKEDFDSCVQELRESLTIDNVEENLEFLEEYYQEVMN